MKRVLIIITLSLVLLSCTKRESSVLDSRPRVGAGITFTLSDTKGNDLLDSTSLHFIDLANVRVWAVDKSGNKFEVTNTAQRNDTIYFGQTLKTKEFILGGINGHKFVLSINPA